MTTNSQRNLVKLLGCVFPIAIAFLFAAFITVLPALGQIVEEGVRQDNVEVLPSSRPIVEYIIAGVCIFGALAIGFKSSNRAQGT